MVWVKRPVERLLDTPEGRVRLLYNRPSRVRATLVLGHGAGGGPDAMDLQALADGLGYYYGLQVIRIEQPWHLAGKKIAPAPAALDRAWIAAIDRLRVRTPVIVGGRSAGARVACRTARKLGAIGCLALAFPLHLPGRPGDSRSHELKAAGVPTLVVQGERDPFGTPYEMPSSVEVAVVPSAVHDFTVPKRGELTQDEALTLIVEAVAEWALRLVGP